MRFQVVDRVSDTSLDRLPTAALVVDDWDDWFTYSTMYTLYFFDEKGSRNRIGSVKIGQFGMKAEQRRPELKDSFTKIGKSSFRLARTTRITSL